MDLKEKQALIDELKQRLSDEHRTLLAAQKATHEAATHEEARPENDKDTRALEQSYLARGQAQRVAQLETDVKSLGQLVVRTFPEGSKIALGAFVQVQDEQGEAHAYILAPAGAGENLDSSLGKVKVVTQHAPLGRALLGCQEEDDVEVRSPTGKRLLTIVGIS